MASLQIDTNFDIENYVYHMLRKYLKVNSKFDPEVYDKAPRKLAKFPTVVVKESNNSTVPHGGPLPIYHVIFDNHFLAKIIPLSRC